MNEYQPDAVSHPGTTIAETMQARGLTVFQLAVATRLRINTLSLMISGHLAITDHRARCLENALGIPASFWIAREAAYREYLVGMAMEKQRTR